MHEKCRRPAALKQLFAGLFTGAIVAVTAALAGVAAAPARAETAPVKIGVLDDMSGVYSALNGMGGVTAARMAIEDFGGKVLGRPIELIYADDQNKPDIGLGIARRWIDVDGVTLVTGLGNSAVALGVQELARNRGVVDIVSGGVSYELTGKACSPTGFHWTHDTYAYASTVPRVLLNKGPKSFFFLTVDYTFGHLLEAEATRNIKKDSGTVVGSVRHPLGTADFSSYLLQAQSSAADIVLLASAGADLISAVKTAREFGLQQSGKQLAALLVNVTDIDALGLAASAGLITATPYYPGFSAGTRQFAERFMARHNGVAPTPNQAGVYSGVLHYLKAVQAAGTTDGPAVARAMRELPIDDMMSKNVRIRADGRVMRDFYVVRVKGPDQKTFPYDYYELVEVVNGENAFRPLADGNCPLISSAGKQ